MSDAFDQNKRRFGKAGTLCIINTGFCAFFVIAFLGLGKNECYTVRDSEFPVTPDTPNAINVSWWFNMTIIIGLVFYAIGVFSSLGYVMKRGPI